MLRMVAAIPAGSRALALEEPRQQSKTCAQETANTMLVSALAGDVLTPFHECRNKYSMQTAR